MHNLLPPHGPVNCRRCFSDPTISAQEWQGKFRWELQHGPGAWGSRDPLIMLLGFSRGETQNVAMANGAFNDAPFKNMRPNIERVLRRLKLLPPSRSFDELVSEHERNFAVGSMLRCSIGKWEPAQGKFIRSGSKMLTDCVSDDSSFALLRNCVSTFQAHLPTRLKLVLLMGNERDYVNGCFQAVKEVRPNMKVQQSVHWKRKDHPVAYGDGVVTWCHFPHGVGRAISHLMAWDEGTGQLQSQKRECALSAVGASGVWSLLEVA